MTLSINAVDADLRGLITSVTQAHDCSPAGDTALWSQLKELGLSDLTGTEEREGSQASWWEAAELVGALARVGCHLPVGDSDLVAGWILDTMRVKSGPTLRCCWWDNGANPVPVFHPLVERVVVIREHASGAEFIEATAAELAARADQGTWGPALTWVSLDTRLERLAGARLALVRAVQTVSAMEAARDLAIDHAMTREQFGRPLVRFQAVQALLADLAAETALARAVTEAAIAVMVSDGDDLDRLLPPLAAAQSCVGHGAATVARAAHQVVGAIGTTQEHQLHRHTAAMLSWRSEAGDTLSADKRVLEFALAGAPISELSFQPIGINHEETS